MSRDELAVRAIIYADGKLLVMKRNRFNEQYITLPGGKVEEGEDPEETVVRELKEETCLDIRVLRKVYVQKTYMKYPGQYIYLCEQLSGGEPRLEKNSIEYKLAKTGNKFQPAYMTLSEIKRAKEPFLPEFLFDELELAGENNFPKTTKSIG